MTTAGLLTVRADFGEGRLTHVDVDLRRPPVTQLFIGQSPEAVVGTVPCLYLICAQAQRAVALAALAAAAGEAPQPADAAGLWIEMLHENLWRLFLDWPPALGLPRSRRHSSPGVRRGKGQAVRKRPAGC